METSDILQRIADSVENVTGISLDEMRSRRKSRNGCLARGVFYCIAKGMGIKASMIGDFLGRSRSNSITLAKRYHYYYTLGDKEIRKIIDNVIKRFDDDCK